MKLILQWWRKRQLRLAKERYAEFKGRREALEKATRNFAVLTINDQNTLVRICGKEARYLERVEELMRD